MNYSGNFLVDWKKMSKEGEDALMSSFDTSIEAKSYIRGCVDTVVSFTKDANEDKLIEEFEVRDLSKRIIT